MQIWKKFHVLGVRGDVTSFCQCMYVVLNRRDKPWCSDDHSDNCCGGTPRTTGEGDARRGVYAQQIHFYPLYGILTSLSLPPPPPSLSPLQQDRLAREFMIAEQNRAYQESLDADREKVAHFCMREWRPLPNILGAAKVGKRESWRRGEASENSKELCTIHQSSWDGTQVY